MRTSTSRKIHGLLPWLALAVGLWAYHNSFTGSFVFDDRSEIVQNLRIQKLWPPWAVMAHSTRPLTDLTFALNYAVGDLRVLGYHWVNLAIHLGATLVLFGILWRMLQHPRLQARYGPEAHGLALAIALIWSVHPLQTESVTYIVQRSEVLMGLWYLLTLYGVLRSSQSPTSQGWPLLTVGACALGMVSKPVMVTAPLLALLYDRVFLAPSWATLWRQRRGSYLGLAATWGLLAWILTTSLQPKPEQVLTSGFALRALTPWEYLRTQPGVLLHYLRLTFWPNPLCLNYQWPIARIPEAILGPSLLVGALLLASLWTLWRGSAVGFLGTGFFLLLAPTSSIYPIRDIAFEHRMYLPLIIPVTLSVLGTWELLGRGVPAIPTRRRVALGLAVAILLALGLATVRRNAVYQDEALLWRDTLSKRPENSMDLHNLGEALFRQGKIEEAISYYRRALQLRPDPYTCYDLGLALATQGHLDEAIRQYEEALRLKPHYVEAHNNLGSALLQQGHLDAAIHHYEEALSLHPDQADTHFNLGLALAQQGRLEEAEKHFSEAVRLNPNDAEARHNLEASRAQIELRKSSATQNRPP